MYHKDFIQCIYKNETYLQNRLFQIGVVKGFIVFTLWTCPYRTGLFLKWSYAFNESFMRAYVWTHGIKRVWMLAIFSIRRRRRKRRNWTAFPQNLWQNGFSSQHSGRPTLVSMISLGEKEGRETRSPAHPFLKMHLALWKNKNYVWFFF